MENTKNILFCRYHPDYQANLISIIVIDSQQQNDESELQLHCVKCLYEKNKNQKQEKFFGENIIPLQDFQHQMKNQYNLCIQNDQKLAISLVSQLKQNQKQLNQQIAELQKLSKLTDDLLTNLQKLNEGEVSSQKQEFLDNLEKINNCQAIGEQELVINYLGNFVQPLSRDLQKQEELFILDNNKLNEYQIEDIINAQKIMENIIRNTSFLKMQEYQKNQKNQWLNLLVESSNQLNKDNIQKKAQNNSDHLLSENIQLNQEIRIKDQKIQELEKYIQKLRNQEQSELVLSQEFSNEQVSDTNNLLVDEEYQKIEREDKLELNQTITLSQLTNYWITIKYCKGRKNGCIPNQTIYGSNPYTTGQGFCATAQHSGVIGDEGGYYIVLKPKIPINNYVGSTKNGYTSVGYGRYEGYYIMSNLNFTKNCQKLKGNLHYCKGTIKGCGEQNSKICAAARLVGKIGEKGGIFSIDDEKQENLF